ncbi:MAG: hypothetical protein WKF74_02835 [Pyrinomonadaceae bacterium]
MTTRARTWTAVLSTRSVGTSEKNERSRIGREYFTDEEAEGKVGERIETLREFSRIPQGTDVKIDQASPNDYSLIVRWDLPNPLREERLDIGSEPVPFVSGGKPFIDWFTRDEYDRYLREV